MQESNTLTSSNQNLTQFQYPNIPYLHHIIQWDRTSRNVWLRLRHVGADNHASKITSNHRSHFISNVLLLPHQQIKGISDHIASTVKDPSYGRLKMMKVGYTPWISRTHFTSPNHWFTSYTPNIRLTRPVANSQHKEENICPILGMNVSVNGSNTVKSIIHIWPQY